MSSYLVTGGAGALGRALTRSLLDDPTTTRVVIFSRDEAKHAMMAAEFGTTTYDNGGRLRFFIGDTRDLPRLTLAMAGVDTVVHAAALKRVEACEYNVLEAKKTNLDGTANVVEAAIHSRTVQRVALISTDKACAPTNAYGASKLMAEKLVTSANAYAGGSGLRFTVVRYGNVFASTGSVIHAWRAQAHAGRELIVRNRSVSRFWFTLDGAVRFVRSSIEQTRGGEVWVPKLPSFRLDDLRKAIAPLAGWRETQLGQGEKLHESMVSEDEAPLTYDCGDRYAICPPIDGPLGNRIPAGAVRVPDGFVYRSDTNTEWLSVEQLRELVQPFVGGFGVGVAA